MFLNLREYGWTAMEIDVEFTAEDRRRALMAVTIVAAFAAGFFLQPTILGSGSGDDADASGGEQAVDRSTVEQKGKQFISSQLPPFVTNIYTVSMTKDTSIEGTDFLWNWKANLRVEPNSFGEWATNETTNRTMNFYLSKNGDYIFPSAPQSTEIGQQRQGLVR